MFSILGLARREDRSVAFIVHFLQGNTGRFSRYGLAYLLTELFALAILAVQWTIFYFCFGSTMATLGSMGGLKENLDHLFPMVCMRNNLKLKKCADVYLRVTVYC
jgi:hypothetical protein